MTRKLAGHAAGTAAWATNVGNEMGQVLISVLTASEGSGLSDMATGLVRRYEKAAVDPPVVLYVDRDCCSSATKRLFQSWCNLQIRLDVWHFMRRLGSCCTTESHPLYVVFMSGCLPAYLSGTETTLLSCVRPKLECWRKWMSPV